MSLWAKEGLRVRIEEVQGDRSPVPKPLSSGFNQISTYEVLAIDNPSETADCYFMLENDRHELWWICQKHLRLVGPERSTTRKLN